MHVAVRDLKNRFSEYLKYAQAGEEIIVTTHGHPVARLVQVMPHQRSMPTTALDKLAWVRRGNGNKLGLVREQRLQLKQGTNLSELLLEDRA